MNESINFMENNPVLAQQDPITIGVAIVIIFILIVAGIRAIGGAIAGAIIGAIIGPLFLDVSIEQGATGGAVVFGAIYFIDAINGGSKKK